MRESNTLPLTKPTSCPPASRNLFKFSYFDNLPLYNDDNSSAEGFSNYEIYLKSAEYLKIYRNSQFPTEFVVVSDIIMNEAAL